MTLHPSESADTAFRATVLVAEDDGPSGQFFKAAFEELGCRVILEDDGQAALAQARRHRFDLLLLDCHMPGASAVRILSALCAEPGAASHAAPAIATSADMGTVQRRQLQQAGFAGTLSKPVTLAALKEFVQPWLPPFKGSPASTMLDDRAALENSGATDAVASLRGLFARELRLLASELDRLGNQPAELDGRLHRLIASCGFCGARALADASRELKRQLASGTAPSTAALHRFRQTLVQTLQALDDSP